ncbi:hypothetical protein L914_02205 [Phytophthora nicotianae]|uniref:Uncharacterized protein n=1 Tax=Phytophthora nicotianae TaxID=4792 RepID=W2P2L5_PHYNI|nr:hypothetical protein L914_02205 [Phytophthora nicotianae]
MTLIGRCDGSAIADIGEYHKQMEGVVQGVVFLKSIQDTKSVRQCRVAAAAASIVSGRGVWI